MMWYRYLNDDYSECIWFLLGQDVKCSQYSKVKWDLLKRGQGGLTIFTNPIGECLK